MAVEKIEIKHTKSRANPVHVPLRKWRGWAPGARQVFNEVFSSMSHNQNLFLHPHTEALSKKMWRTTCWNAAWIAADAAQDASDVHRASSPRSPCPSVECRARSTSRSRR